MCEIHSAEALSLSISIYLYLYLSISISIFLSLKNNVLKLIATFNPKMNVTMSKTVMKYLIKLTSLI